MKGDFSRNTFDPFKHFTRVLMQQGRVQRDADWNEQAAILLRYLHMLAADLIGPHGGLGNSFLIQPAQGGFSIDPGHYYVDGMLCENDPRLDSNGNVIPLSYYDQVDYPVNSESAPLPAAPFLVYLDVWERLVTYIQDDAIREVALGGPDTAARARLVWQVRVTNQLPDGGVIGPGLSREGVLGLWDAWVASWQPAQRGLLRARARLEAQELDPCITDPEARYRGAENQLYRVEIHRSGSAWEGTDAARGTAATFKFSRENGSVVFPVRGISGLTLSLEHLGRDAHLGLKVDDWVELVDDEMELLHQAGPLLQVEQIDTVEMAVTLKWPADVSNADLPDYSETEIANKHPLLRRWDHKAGSPTRGGLQLSQGAALLRVGSPEQHWLTLEDGIQVHFDPGSSYRQGDYWLIPARTATGDVEWPGLEGQPDALPPYGVQHHYAPLAFVPGVGTTGAAAFDLRRTFQHLAT